MSTKPVNSRQKGKRGEREAVRLLRSFGFAARRTAQNCGKSGDAADVVCDDLPGVHFEVKFLVKGLSIGTAMFARAWAKLLTECGAKEPVLLWRPTGSRVWLMTYRGDVNFGATVEANQWVLEHLSVRAQGVKP